ncbi:helix-turn-helix domain-containing protein [Microbacterium halophytorum]|uniref:helix-turn-helix domain-containing protein n=1 Tax=Microbacterium halophytorum TaxID=2067568 RepID=UPI000CFC4CDE|nr:helix-turn-helix domain-containing protein [Microbacterium halophytorum]
MPTQLLEPGAILIEDQVREEARTVVETVRDRRIVGTKVVLDDATEVELPAELAELVSFVLSGVTQGSLSIRSTPDELTTRTASQLIGISRPTLMKLVEQGEIPSHKVGTHHRFAHRDVVDFVARRREEQRRALVALRGIDEEFPEDD